MPFYEYECQACKFYTEVMQKITDAPLTRCPSCGKRTLKKLVSAPAFRLKGVDGAEHSLDEYGDAEAPRLRGECDPSRHRAQVQEAVEQISEKFGYEDRGGQPGEE